LDDLRRLRLIGCPAAGAGPGRTSPRRWARRFHRRCAPVCPLVKLGWLSRAESGEFSLTDSGRFLVEQAEGIAEKAARRWFAENGLDPSEVSTIAGSAPDVDAQWTFES
jgi:hypothetical protein